MQVGDELTIYRFGPHKPRATVRIKLTGVTSYGAFYYVKWIKTRQAWCHVTSLITPERLTAWRI